MCGIAGYFSAHQPAQVATVRAMCDQIRHRGPDDEGFHVDGGCAIGMRRLSIIDLSTGHQPICNEDGSLWIVFNGEIYSYQDLHRELVAQGHRFRTESDTETILHLYEQYGPEGFARLRGMFAFCLWDARRGQLILARDRFGKKPLYYHQDHRGLTFGSELKCLRAAGVPLAVNDEALRLYFQFNYIPEPLSCYRDVLKLPPGSWLRYDTGTGRTERGRFWQLPVPTETVPADFNEEAAGRQLCDVFDEAVRIRMIADVPLGAFLSGGIDSSLVVASMARQSKEPVKTFSIGFPEASFNELPYARMVADRYGTDHREIMVEPDTVDLLPKLMWHFDEPFGDNSMVPTYLVSQATAEHVKVALSGDGGDEMFGGYTTFAAVDRLRKYDRVPKPVRSAIGAVADRLPYSARGKNFLRMISRQSAIERYFEFNYAPWYLRQRLLRPEWMLLSDFSYLAGVFGPAILPDADPVSQAMYFESLQNLTGDMLVKVDRMSMAASLEVRSPLLDQDLAAFAQTIPNAYKIRNGRLKYLLVKSMEDRLPPALLNRSKMGFAFPLAIWFRTSLRAFLWDHLLSDSFLQRGIVEPSFVQFLLTEHDTGRRDNQQWLFCLLALELWFRQMEDAPVERESISVARSL